MYRGESTNLLRKCGKVDWGVEGRDTVPGNSLILPRAICTVLRRGMVRARGMGCSVIIEEVWKQKPRQTVVVVFWGKIAAHMASIKTV